jgi:hypothetical protein
LDVREACDYTYIPLQHPDSIRLLRLPPGEMDSPIQLYLAEFRLQENPLYEAVSYTGPPKKGTAVYLTRSDVTMRVSGSRRIASLLSGTFERPISSEFCRLMLFVHKSIDTKQNTLKTWGFTNPRALVCALQGIFNHFHQQ